MKSHTSAEIGLSRRRIGGAAAGIAAIVVLLTAAVACDEPASTATPAPTATVTGVPSPTAEPTPTSTPYPTPAPTATPTPASTPTPDLSTAQGIIAAAAAAMDALQSGSLRSEIIGLEGHIPQAAMASVTDVDFQAPDRSRSVSTTSFGEFDIEQTSIFIGEDNYHWDLMSGGWTHSRDDYCVERPNLRCGRLNLHFSASDVESVILHGVEELDGEMVYYLAGQVPYSVVVSLQGGEIADGDSELGPADAEFWIGVEDFLVRKLTTLFQDIDPQSGNLVTVRSTITFSDFGKPVDIQPPPTRTPRP